MEFEVCLGWKDEVTGGAGEVLLGRGVEFHLHWCLYNNIFQQWNDKDY